MSGIRIAIFHYAPLEYFPPVQNMLSALAGQMADGNNVVVYTTLPNKTEPLFEPGDKRIRIIRTGNFSFGLSQFQRYVAYLKYYFISLFGSIKFQPEKLLYYETISSLSPVLYKTLINRNAGLFIHYHEYMTPEEYNGMFLNRNLLNLEKKVFDKAEWISHTNAERLKLFCRDTGYNRIENIHELPNYPPGTWNVKRKERTGDGKLKLVYVGSFGSMDTIYIREIVEWVSKHSRQISLDIFSNNISKEVQEWISKEPRKGISFHGNIPNNGLPEILPWYDVGLILYKGASVNFVYNAPNKLFEYLVCGLDVWYPKEMLGIYSYDCETANPRVIRCDFSQLGEIPLSYVEGRARLPEREINFRFEAISAPLIQKILSSQKP